MTILRFLLENADARKVFGKRELKIIEKQLWGVSLTQSEKNRLSRDIRKKLEFIRKAARFEEEFRLKKGSEVEQRIDDAVNILLHDPLSKKIKEIILYGSVAENKATLESDIDLAVHIDNTNLKEATLLRKRVLGKLDKKVDVQVYNYLPEKIKEEIKLKGRVLYKNEDRR